MVRTVAIAGLVLGLHGALGATPTEPHAPHAGAPREPRASTIRVLGEATVTTRPDRAELDITVVTSAATARDAAAGNARKLDAVLTALRGALPESAHIETIGYMVRPDYGEATPGAAPAIRGYTARSTVRVTLDELARIGAVIDTATEAGANEVERIAFSLAREDEARARALREAAHQARAKAQSLADGLGLTVVRISSVQETSPVVRPMHEMALARDAGPATPIVPGAIETTATVELSLEVTPRAASATASPPSSPPPSGPQEPAPDA